MVSGAAPWLAEPAGAGATPTASPSPRAVADDALQVHGGNGYAVECPVSRVLCDSRILNIFEAVNSAKYS